MNASNPIQNKWLLSTVCNAILYLAFFSIFSPSYNSGDDVFLLFNMAGGFGDSPTEFLHYNHIVHPFLGFVVKTLFSSFPNINWFTILLYGFQFISTIIFLKTLLSLHKKPVALLLFFIFFFFNLTFFLLSPNFTNTAGLGFLISFAWLLYACIEKKKFTYYVGPVLLLVASSLFRIHVFVPVFIVFTPFFLFSNIISQWKRVLIVLAIVGIFIVLLNKIHTYYYEKNIPNWTNAENFRQAYFSYINNSAYKAIGNTSYCATECSLLDNGFLIDKQFLSVEKISTITSIGNFSSVYRNLLHRKIGLHFFSILTGVSFFLIVVALTTFLLFPQLKGRRDRWLLLLSALLTIAISAILFSFFKLPAYILVFLTSAVVACNLLLSTINVNGRSMQLAALCLVPLCIWNVNRVYKMNKTNLLGQKKFEICQREVGQHPDRLFVMLNDVFPFAPFSVWKTPQQYPVKNVLCKDFFLIDEEDTVLRRFGLTSMRQIWNNPRVLFWGRETKHAEEYCKKVFAKELQFEKGVSGFTYSVIRPATLK